MKRILMTVPLTFLLGCNVFQDVFPDQPTALFSIEKDDNGKVALENLSEQYESYTISWGDGEVTTRDGLPSLEYHQYEIDGDYNIELTAFSHKKKKEDSYMTSVNIDNTEGTFMVYLGSKINAEYVKYYIEKPDGTLDLLAVDYEYYSGNESLDCSANIGLKKKMKPGVYTFVGTTVPVGRGYWTAEFKIENDNCTVRVLN